MTIYHEKRTPSKVYRKIYEQHFGPIPRDGDGRSYDVHHIDGNHSNNDPKNLKALSIKDHYDVHYSQGDWLACHWISARMKCTPNEISEAARKSLLDKINPFSKRSDGTSVTYDRVNSTGYVNPWSTRPDGTSLQQDKVMSGSHPLLRRPDGTSVASDRVAAGTNPFQKRADGSSINQGKNHPRCDLSEYTFVHRTGQIETLTCYEMNLKYKINARFLVRGKSNTSGGWRIVK